MNQIQLSKTQGETYDLEPMFASLVQTLESQVTRLRGLRDDGRSEAFAGLMMRDDDIADLCREMAGGQWHEVPPFHPEIPLHSPLAHLIKLYELSSDEAALLVLAMAPAVDPRFGKVYGFLHEDMARQHLTPALAQRLLPNGGIHKLQATLSRDASLLRHGMVRLVGDPWILSRIDMPDAMLSLILGTAQLPPQVTSMPLPGQPDWAQQPRLLQGSTAICPVMAAGFTGPLWICDRMDPSEAAVTGVAAALAGASIAYAGWDDAPINERRALAAGLGRHCAILTEQSDQWLGLGISFDLHLAANSTHLDRCKFWQSLAPHLAPQLAASRLPTALLWRLAQEAAQGQNPQSKLDTMLRQLRAAPMRGLADRIDCPHDFNDLILPDTLKQRLQSFAARHTSAPQVLESWGLGHSLSGRPGGIALFTGPSGVGKTMAAGVVARATGLDLMRINLATVVSKYIGETESNLERIFGAAAQSEVILFFDEAESLFSKRTEVKDAHDRYANMEMSYLLQRIESFHGMAILASNMGAMLDPALLRRFDLVLDFALPDAKARRDMWRKIKATSLPLAQDVDLDLLADRFDLAGGHIRQAILSAAHAAAQGAGQLTQTLLIAAIAREYTKLGRPLRREDFGADYDRVRVQ